MTEFRKPFAPRAFPMLREPILAFVLVAGCGLAVGGQPGLHVGAAFIWTPSTLVVGGSYDSSVALPTYAIEDAFSGATVTGEYWPHRMVGVRLTLAQLSGLAPVCWTLL